LNLLKFALGTPTADSVTMTKAIPTIQKFMTYSPHTIGADQTMVHAHRLMREHKIRHLPVLRGGHIVGVLSDGDLNLIETLKDVNPETVLVEDAMTEAPYTVAPETPLDEVVSAMAEHKYGSTVVLQNDKVVGIFTTVDACRAFAELLHSRLTH
jgi:acetoin utilization protein AcuB